MASGTIPTVYIDRKCSGEFTMVSKTKTIVSTDLKDIIPDGAKILSMKLCNTNGRKLAVRIPALTSLILTGGNADASNVELTRRAYAPITHFPTIRVEIPDLIARNVDVDSTVGIQPLFVLTTDGATDVVIVKFHYKMAI